MEYLLLAKIGMIVKGIVTGGYCLAGSYFIRTGIRYIQDYRESVSREKGA